jgi:predicted dehydrogenase
MSTSIKIGIIGGGMVSQIAHLPFYLADQRCEVVAVAESRPSLVRHLSEALRVKRVVTDHHVLLDDPGISAVIIIAPRPATGPLTLSALAAGKDVLVEKPLAHTLQQATKLLNKAVEMEKILGVAFMKRYDPGVQQAKQELDRLVNSGLFGQLLLARFYDYARDYAYLPPPHKRPEESRTVRFETWPTSPDWLSRTRADDYAWFMNAASHDINLLTYFFPVNELHLMHASSPVGGGLTATFEANRTPIVFELAKSASGKWLQGAEFIFEKGRLLLEMPSPMAVDQVGRVRINENNGTASVRELSVEKVWSFKCQAHAFVGNLLDRDMPLTNGVDAMNDLRLIEEIWQRIEHNEAKHVH